MRKALIQLHLKQIDAAKLTLRAFLQAHPDNLTGWSLLTRVVAGNDEASEGAAVFQQGLAALSEGQRAEFLGVAATVGSALARAGFYPAAIKHLDLAIQVNDEESQRNASLLHSLKIAPDASLWERNPYQLWPAPENATPAFRESFERALGWAREGLWSAAASAFELLAAGSGVGAIADRNRGLCCLWIADQSGAIAALRRYSARTGPTPDTVDLEALCQKIERPAPRDQVEFVHLSWPIRNRDGLVSALRGNAYFAEASKRPLDPNDAKSAEVERFFLLDRPRIEAKSGLTRRDIPMVMGDILLSSNAVILETHDDGRLDQLVDRFTAAAGANIPPAHPRTKIMGKHQRHLLAVSWRWNVPEGLGEEDFKRLNDEQGAYIIREVWPETPHPSLRWRTPVQAAKTSDLETALRAAVMQLQSSGEPWVELIDWDQFRVRLNNLKPEPPIDPEHVDIAAVSLPRMPLIPLELLDDDRILALYARAREWGVRPVFRRVGQLIDSRPALMVKGQIEAPALYGELALDAAQRNDRAAAVNWLARGRQSEPPRKRSAHEIAWEMIELQIQMILEEPEVWVKTLAVILERYRGNQEATSAVVFRLIKLGLIQVVPDPNREGQLVLDTRVLGYYLSEFGPRVTTATGELGVASARNEIWTPGSERAASGSALWTPGSAAPAAAGGGKSNLIVPGT